MPINLTSEIEQYINLGKNSNFTTETSITWNAAGHTLKKKAPNSNLGLPTGGQGTAWAEDTPPGLANENTIIGTGPAAGSQLIIAYAWRNFRKWILDKAVINFALAMNATANAGNDCNFDSFSYTFRQYYGGGAPVDIIPPSGNIATGHTTLTGAGTQSYIYEEPFKPNFELVDNSIIVLAITMNTTVGTATLTNCLLPAFPYQKTNATKWYSQSGVYMLGRGIV